MDQIQEQEKEKQKQQQVILKIENIKIIYDNNNNWLDKIVPLNEKKIIIYFDGGEWILYDIDKRQQEKKGQIANNVKVFFQVWEGTLFYVCPDTLIVKLIDFNTGLINVAYEFPASVNHNSQSEINTRETIAERLLIGLTQFQDFRFLVTIEQQRQYSNENPAIIQIRNVQEKYDSQSNGLEQVIFQYEYQNITGQSEMFIYKTDPSTLVLFGQDFENGQMEFVLIKPHLGNKALKVIKIQDEQSYTLMNITNWFNDNQIAIWLNNNDQNSVPLIQLIDCGLYYDKVNNTYIEEEVPWKPDNVFVQFQDDPPQTLIDVIMFPQGSGYAVLQRLVGVEPYISLIDWKTHRLINEYHLGDDFYYIPQNREYIIQYDDNQDEKLGQASIKLYHLDLNPRFHALHLMEQSNLIQKYGIDSIFEIFEILNK